MSFATKIGISAPNSYWIPVQVNTCKIDKYAHIVFYGYYDESARNAKQQNIGQKSYSITDDDEYDTWFSTENMDEEGNNILKIAYEYALAQKETENGLADGYTEITIEEGDEEGDARVGETIYVEGSELGDPEVTQIEASKSFFTDAEEV